MIEQHSKVLAARQQLTKSLQQLDTALAGFVRKHREQQLKAAEDGRERNLFRRIMRFAGIGRSDS